MTRRTSVTVAQRNEPIVQQIRALKAEHPFWGYRRICAHRRFVDWLLLNKKRVLRLMRAPRLLVKANPRLKATRTPTRSKPRPTGPNQWWGIDLTKVMVEPVGWTYLVVVLDWYTKKIGAPVSRGTSRHASPSIYPRQVRVSMSWYPDRAPLA